MPIRTSTVVAAASLALGIVVLFAYPAEQYFMGDSIALLIARPTTWHAAIHDLWRLGGTHWYRPLSNGWLPFLLWPHWGLDFQPYHQLAMALHWAFSFGLFLWLRHRLRDDLAAWIGAAFFAFHPIQFYATYDLAFYQEPMGAGFTLAALACFLHGKRLPLGVLFFALALVSRENSVVLPALLIIMVWPRMKAACVTASAMGAAFFAWYTWHLHPLRSQPEFYQPYPNAMNWATNWWHAIRWSAGIPAGDVTRGWQSPLIVQALLWICLVAIGIAVALRVPDAMHGVAWFTIAGAAAFSTRHLAPHHIYLALVGIALAVATLFAQARRSFPRLAMPTAAALLTSLFVTSLIAARFDSVNSWLGESSWSAREPAAYTRDLARSRGILVYTSDADLSFSWEVGNIFRLLAGDSLEARLVNQRPVSAPEGIRTYEYSKHMLRPLKLPTSTATTPSAVDFSLEPRQIQPGTSYRIRVPQLAGAWIDLKYSYNDRLPTIAYSFAQLDAHGEVQIPCPASISWGRVEVLGVRVSGGSDWARVRAHIDVLP